MFIWLTINSVFILMLTAVVYVLLRQTALILKKVGSVGARSTSDGPRIGENISSFLEEWDGLDGSNKALLLILASKSCAVCSVIRKAANSLSRFWSDKADILFVYEDTQEDVLSHNGEASHGVKIAFSKTLRPKLGAGFVPFAIITDERRIVLGKGLVNDMGHLESLLELYQKQSEENKEKEEVPLYA